jgi:hypothetical protein
MRPEQSTATDPPRSGTTPNRITLTRTHRVLIGIVASGAVIIAGIGFAGSYAAVRELALHKGFGNFAYVFPVGVDAGIVVLLALDLLLTWLRIPFPLLRQTAWLLTAATIAFNGAAAWPDPLGVGMHGVIPVLFVVAVEAARHAIGRIADITADKHMEGVRITRWLLAPVPTFRLWRRMKLWELRSYEEVIRREQDRLVYRARLRARYGVAWRRRAPIEAMMPLRLARYGVPLADTAPAGLAAAGIEVPLRATEEAPAVAESGPAPVELEWGHQAEEPQLAAVPSAEAELPPPAPAYTAPAAHAAPEPEQLPSAGPSPIGDYRDDFPGGEELPTWEPEAQRTQEAPVPVAARPDGRVVAQMRVPLEEEVDLVPLDGPADEPATEEPVLTGTDLLEHRYLQLSPDERQQSAAALARLLSPGTGFTEGTARKYLKPIIDRHQN